MNAAYLGDGVLVPNIGQGRKSCAMIRIHTRTHIHTHARTHARTHTRLCESLCPGYVVETLHIMRT